MSFSINHWKEFDEIWRFEECAALFENVKFGNIVFFDKNQSNALWSMLISKKIKHLMEIKACDNIFINEERYDVSFDDWSSSDNLFKRFFKRSHAPDLLFLFFGFNSACILKFSLLSKFWNEIFLPSDETTIAVDANSQTVLFSFENRFFIASKS